MVCEICVSKGFRSEGRTARRQVRMACSGRCEVGDGAKEGYPPRVFCTKSMDLLENAADRFCGVAKEFGSISK